MSVQHKKQKPPRGPHHRGDDDEDDPVPADIDEFRLELARRIATFVQAWRTCRCRRARRCAARTTCASIANRVPPSPHEDAAVMANVYRQVQRRLAESMRRSTRKQCRRTREFPQTANVPQQRMRAAERWLVANVIVTESVN